MIILSEADRRRVAMRRALRALAAQGEPAGWQGRWLDMSDATEGWSDWRFIDTIDIERWEKRCKDKPNYYMMRPLYAAPVPSGTNYPALIKQYIPAPQAQPLTEEQIKDVLMKVYPDSVDTGEWKLCDYELEIFRAAERAHGIGVEK